MNRWGLDITPNEAAPEITSDLYSFITASMSLISDLKPQTMKFPNPTEHQMHSLLTTLCKYIFQIIFRKHLLKASGMDLHSPHTFHILILAFPSMLNEQSFGIKKTLQIGVIIVRFTRTNITVFSLQHCLSALCWLFTVDLCLFGIVLHSSARDKVSEHFR